MNFKEYLHLLKFKTHHGEFELTDGTSLQGSITCQYDRLVKIFGEPYRHDVCGQSDVDWTIQFVDGMVGTIYNWKDGPCYKGLLGTPVEQITGWNVGGRYAPIVPRIRELIAKSFVEEINDININLSDEFDEFTKY